MGGELVNAIFSGVWIVSHGQLILSFLLPGRVGLAPRHSGFLPGESMLIRGQVEPKILPILPSLAFLLSDCPSLPFKIVDTAYNQRAADKCIGLGIVSVYTPSNNVNSHIVAPTRLSLYR